MGAKYSDEVRRLVELLRATRWAPNGDANIIYLFRSLVCEGSGSVHKSLSLLMGGRALNRSTFEFKKKFSVFLLS